MISIEVVKDLFNLTDEEFYKVFRGATLRTIDGKQYIPKTDVKDKLTKGFLSD